MHTRQWLRQVAACLTVGDDPTPPVRTDGGDSEDDADERDENGRPAETGGETRNETEVGEAEPAEPKWDRPDMDDIPEFEIHGSASAGGGMPSESTDRGDDPTAGRPNTARTPEQSRINREGTEGYVAALELCARLPEDVRLPAQAADLVPAAVEAELEDDLQRFAAAEFDNHSPHVDELSFVETDDEIWLRIRLGIRPEEFDDLDPEAIRNHALQELDGLF